MTDQSIFDKTQQTSTTPTPPTDDVNNLLSQIRNENGEQKYKTLQDALVGLQHAQEFIKTLRTEKSTLEEELNGIKPVAEKVTELEKVVLQLTKPQEPVATPTSGLSEEAIAKLVETTLTKRQQEDVAKQNLTSVITSVRAEFGDKAEEVFYAKAAEIGLSKQDINALAARTPQAVLKLIGVSQKSTTVKPTTTTNNTSSFTPSTETFIGRNSRRLEVGATASELMEETLAARRMVAELNEKGMSIDDLTKPANYFKFFK